VPWLTETPVSGTVSSGGNTPVVLGFDAAYVDQPGEYHAELIVKNDTPYGKFSVPVTMTVTAPQSWGKLTGTVTGLGVCDGDPAPLEEAEVLVESATTGETWLVTTDVSGTYHLWLDQAHSPLTVTVSAPDYYGQATGVVVRQGQTTVLDFNLRLLKPCLSYNPADFDVTLPMGDNTTQPLTLVNSGAGDAAYELLEVTGGFTPLNLTRGHVEYLPMAEPTNGPVNAVHNGPLSTAASRVPYTYHGWAPQAVNIIAYADDDQHNPTAVENALQALGLSYTFYGYDDSGANLSAFVSAVQGGGWDLVIYAADSWALIDASDYQAVADHVAGGGMAIAQSWAIGYDATHQNHVLWTLLGGSYAGWLTSPANLYWWNPAHPIFSGVPEFTNLNDLGYLAYGARMNLLGDPATGLGGFATTPTNGQAGVILSNADRTIYKGLTDNLNSADVDSDGTWDATEWWSNAINYLLNPGEFGGGIPWLTEAPVTGTVAADANAPVALTFDAGVPETMQPGTYYGQLKVKSNAANEVPNVPVTLTVTAPATWGKIAGVVTGLGYCDVATPTLLAGAVVTVESGTGLVAWVLETDANGAYTFWVDAAHSPVTLTVSFDDHVTRVITNVVVTAGATTTQNVALRWAKPCFSVDPDMFNVTVTLGMSTTLPLDLINQGAADTPFRFTERNGGWIISRALFEGPTVQVGGNAMRLGPTTPRSEPSGVIPTADVIQDGSFEDGTPNTFWDEYSTNFGTPICDVPSCGTGTGTGPRTGDFWVWFGGINAYEEGWVAQDVNIPTGIATLNFWLEQIVCGSPTDYMQVLIDGDEVFATDGTSPICGVLGYSEVVVDVTDYADGGIHNIMFYSESDAGSNIFVDDVVLDVVAGTPDLPWLSEDPESGTVAADSTEPVDLTFDAGVPEVVQPGVYFGTLFVNSDDPVNAKIAVPVTMTVVPPATWGKLMGTVTGQGYCDADPQPLAGAEVLIESWMTRTTTMMGVLLTEDFEANDGGYTHSGTEDEWAWGTPTAWPNACASGTSCWGTDLAGNYNNSADQTLLSPVIDLSGMTPGDPLTVAWQQAWSTESGYDYAYAEVSINGGGWTQMWSGTGTNNNWTEMTYDISAAAGGTVQFRWRLTSDSSVTYPGYYVDNVRILGPVEIVEPVNWLLTTDISGTYQTWIDEMYSPVTITVSYPDYEKGEAIVTVTGGTVITRDFDLRMLAPCVQAEPMALHATLGLGDTATQVFTLTNTGLLATDWTLTEENLGAPTVTPPGVLVLFSEDFEGAFPPTGWNVVENIGSCQWESSATTGYTNQTGGSGLFADANSDWCGTGMDTELWTSSFDLSAASAPVLSFHSDFNDYGGADDGYVDISTDGGATWTNLLHYDGVDVRGPYLEQIDLSAYAGQPNVIIRFHYVAGDWDWYWQVDDVQIADVDPVVWLAENPASGNLAADTGVQAVDVDFDASVVPQPGDYVANLLVNSDDPFSPLVLPVTMTVTPPATWGQLLGTVYSLGRCDVTTATLAGAQVVIWDATATPVVTLTTNISGTYSYWLPTGDYTVTVTAADHVPAAPAVVTVPAAGEVMQDFSLVWIGPCLSVETVEYHLTMPMGMSDTLPMTLTNAGLGAADFALSDVQVGFVPSGLLKLQGSVPTYPPASGNAAAAAELVGAEAPKNEAPTPSPIGQISVPYAPVAALYDNGPLVNSPGTGAGGADESMLQSVSLGMTTLGFGHQVASGNRIADDFTVPAGGWYVDTITFFAYQTGSSLVSTISAVNLQIWNGVPGAPGSSVIFGDTTTNRLINTTWSGIYRVSETSSGDTQRPIMANTVKVGVMLPPGTYWLDWQSDGTLSSGPWAPPVTINGQATTGNALQYTSGTGTWNAALDGGTGTQQDFPFIIEGQDAPWLFEIPNAGTVPAGGQAVVDILMDANYVQAPGEYYGTILLVTTDAGLASATYPATLTVTLPDTYGQITGTVKGLGPCDNASVAVPLEGAEVTVESAARTWTLLTDAGGRYSLWLDETHSPVTITVNAAGYVSDVVTGVAVISGTTTVQNFGLSPEAPCAYVTPEAVETTLTVGMSTTVPITIGNTGIYTLSWVLSEEGDVPWLAEAPTSGDTAPGGGTSAVTVTFDAADLMPGEYAALLALDSAMGNTPIFVPVTMTVEPPADWGRLVGLVQGLGYCNVMTTPLEGAVVFVESEMTDTVDILFSTDFEANDGGFTHSGVQDEWQWGVPTAWPNTCASGSRCWGTDLADTYNASADQTLLSPVIDLSAVAPGTVLTATWQQAWYLESATYDHAYAEVSINGGAWTQMWSHTGSTTQVSWTPMSYIITAAAGGTVQFRWRLTSDSSVQYAGYYIDDVRIQSAVPVVVPMNWTLVTNAAGEYGYWFNAMYSPFTVTVSYEGGYEAQVFTDVAVTGGATTTLNANLIWLQPCITVAPQALELNVPMGTTSTVALNLANMGAFTGTFLLNEWSQGFNPLGPLATGGPDAFGYRYADSNDLGISPVYDFVDISAVGTPLTLGDNDYAQVPIGFPFKFYGTSAVNPNVYSTVFVGSNGFLTFDAGSTDLSPDPTLPDPTLPNNLIAVAWDDLKPGTVYYQSFAQCPYNPARTTVDACFVVQYSDFKHADDTPAGTWEVILFRSGSILTQYAEVDAPNATTGIENKLGLVGLTYMPNLADELAICFAYPGEWTDCQSTQVPWLDTDVDEGNLAVGGSAVVNVTFDARVPEVYAPGDYLAELWLMTNDPHQEFTIIPVTMTVAQPESLTRLEGVVTGWSQCDAESAPLAGALVEITTSSGDGFVLTTDVTGAYAAWLKVGDAYTVTVSKAGYVPVTVTGTAQTAMLPRNVALRTDAPCISVTPTSFDVTVAKDRTLTRTLTIHNTGAGAFAFNNIFGSSLWLSVTPKTGVVPADGTQDVILVFDATGLVAGDVYSTVLEVAHSNAAISRLFVRPVRMTVVDTPQLLVDVIKTASPAMVLPGGLITYTVVFTNSYDRPLDVTANDPIPVNTTYVLGSAYGGATVLDPPANLLTWSGTLPANESASFGYVVRVGESVARGTLITNTVTITADSVPFTAEVVVLVGPLYHSIFLPLVLRNAQ